jgi:hypothetical protein
MTKDRLLKILNLVFLGAFLLSALVQLNDPDPLRWIGIYSAMVVICGLQHFGRLRWYIAAVPVLICAGWIVSLLPALNQGVPWSEVLGSLTMQNDTVEEVREIGGLLLVLLWAAALSNVTYSKAHNSHST